MGSLKNLLRVAFVGVLAAGCGQGDGNLQNGSVQIAVSGFSALRAAHEDPLGAPATLRINVGGGDIATQSFDFPVPEVIDRMDQTVPVPFGEDRFLEAEVLNLAGEGLYAGQTRVTVQRGAPPPPVVIHLAPVRGPTGLAAAAGPRTVTLTWTPVRGIATYNVYGDTNGGVQPAPAHLVSLVEGNAFSHKDLTPGMTYHYVVTAVNSVGESEPGNEVAATPLAPVPGEPTGDTAGGDGMVTVTWDAVPWAESYELFWSELPDPVGSGQVIPGIEGLSYTLRGLKNGTTYYFAVRAVNGSGAGPAAVLPAAVPHMPVPDGPTGLAATGGDGVVMLSWNPVAGAVSYVLFWSTVPGVTPQNGQAIPAGNGTNYTHSGRTNGTTYYYRVLAVNAEGVEGRLGGEVSAVPRGRSPAPPIGLRARAGDGQVTLSWSAVSGATSYTLYWGIRPDVTPATGNPIPVSRRTYTHRGLVNGRTYYYVVTAVNGEGESGPSNEASARPTGVPPGLPDLQIRNHGLVTAGTSLDLVFDLFNGGTAQAPAVGPPPDLEVAVCTDPFGSAPNCVCDLVPGPVAPGGAVTRSTLFSSTLVDIVILNNWYIAADPRGLIRELNEGNNTACSGALCTTPPSVGGVCLPPPAPTGLSTSPFGTACELTVQWNPVPGATSYQLYYSMTTGVTSATGTLASNGPTTTHTIFDCTIPIPTYFLVVTATNALGTSPDSAELAAQPNP